jgi:hypothetical protein
MKSLSFAALTFSALMPLSALAQIPPQITTPDKLETRLGPLEFKDGVPSKATAEKVYDHLDFTYAYRAFMDNMRGVSVHAMRKGLLDFSTRSSSSPSWPTPSRCSSRPTPTRSTPSASSISRTDPSCWRCRPSCSAPSTTTGSAG